MYGSARINKASSLDDVYAFLAALFVIFFSAFFAAVLWVRLSRFACVQFFFLQVNDFCPNFSQRRLDRFNPGQSPPTSNAVNRRARKSFQL